MGYAFLVVWACAIFSLKSATKSTSWRKRMKAAILIFFLAISSWSTLRTLDRDLNSDGQVDHADFFVLSESWKQNKQAHRPHMLEPTSFGLEIGNSFQLGSTGLSKPTLSTFKSKGESLSRNCLLLLARADWHRILRQMASKIGKPKIFTYLRDRSPD